MVIPISVYKDNDYFNKIAIYFCLPIAIVNVIYYTNYLEFFTSTSGKICFTRAAKVKILSTLLYKINT